MKLWAPELLGVLVMGIPGFPFGSPKRKCYLDVAPWRGTKNNIKGKVVASPKSRPW
jgi:hypothetical protein